MRNVLLLRLVFGFRVLAVGRSGPDQPGSVATDFELRIVSSCPFNAQHVCRHRAASDVIQHVLVGQLEEARMAGMRDLVSPGVCCGTRATSSG
jgi:hypothetical protein